MKVIAFASSSSKNSINKQLVTYAASLLKSEIVPQSEIEILDLNDFEAPLYSIDIEAESDIPEAVSSQPPLALVEQQTSWPPQSALLNTLEQTSKEAFPFRVLMTTLTRQPIG